MSILLLCRLELPVHDSDFYSAHLMIAIFVPSASGTRTSLRTLFTVEMPFIVIIEAFIGRNRLSAESMAGR